MDNLILNPSIPYFGLLVNKFAPQSLIRINGVVSQTTYYRFEINLHCGQKSSLGSDIALQLRVFVRLLNESISVNSFRHGSWEEELCKSIVPIRLGEKFEIILLCTFDQYKIIVNGQLCLDFPQRVHYDKISHLSIEGNISISQISYESASGTNFSSLPDNEYNMQVYPTLLLHNLKFNDESCCEELYFPNQSAKSNCLSALQLNSVINDGNVVTSNAHHDHNDKHYCLKSICLVIFAIIIIIVIAFFIFTNGKHTY